ncbi:hypothetical protein COO60DRAFT_1502825 [Scenedesmus sp. NREL 46B-D3]|nr:hypothetical protein COO60DRAFT_1502825 [Scenedesmus sp. NREL 46B-D3]
MHTPLPIALIYMAAPATAISDCGAGPGMSVQNTKLAYSVSTTSWLHKATSKHYISLCCQCQKQRGHRHTHPARLKRLATCQHKLPSQHRTANKWRDSMQQQDAQTRRSKLHGILG